MIIIEIPLFCSVLSNLSCWDVEGWVEMIHSLSKFKLFNGIEKNSVFYDIKLA